MMGSAMLLLTQMVLRARAEDDVGTLRMLPNQMFAPTIAMQVALTATLNPDYPLLADTAIDLRGVPGPRAGSTWLGIDGHIGIDALGAATGDPETKGPAVFEARLTPWHRTSQSAPIVAAQDLRVATLSARRDRPMDIEFAAQLQVIDWSGGLYLPANRPGDLDARIVIGLRALGAEWRRAPRSAGPSEDLYGASLGGLSGELVYGRRFGRCATLTGHLGASADWSIGARHGFVATTETEVWIGGVLDLGVHDALRLYAGTRTLDESTDGSLYLPTLTLGWRATW
jgi:hypothetical protein